MDEKEKAIINALKEIAIAEIFRDCIFSIIFADLAIMFKTWWIVLFSILAILVTRALDDRSDKNE